MGSSPARACPCLSRCEFGLRGTAVYPHGWSPPLESLGTWAVEGPFPVPSRVQAGRGRAEDLRETPAGLTPSSPADVIHTVGPIAHGEPSTSQATELRSCYLSSLDLLLEHRLRSAVRAPGAGREKPGAGVDGPEGGGGAEAESDDVPISSPLSSQAFPCISTGVFGEWGPLKEAGRSGRA